MDIINIHLPIEKSKTIDLKVGDVVSWGDEVALIVAIHGRDREVSLFILERDGGLYEKVDVDDLDGVYTQAIIDVNLINDWMELE